MSLAPSNTEILFALGLGPRIVGVSDFSDYPPAAKTKPSVGGVILNIERILALKPDLLIGFAGLQAGQLQRLDALGLRVFAIDPHSIADTITAIQRVGEVTGARSAATAITRHMRNQLSAVRSQVALARSRPRVLVVVQWKPLIVVGPGTFLNDAVRLAGGLNVAADARASYPPYSVESAIAERPDVILFTGPVVDVASDPAWRTVPAARTRRLHSLPPDILDRPGPRLANGVTLLARLLHPELSKSARYKLRVRRPPGSR